MKAIVVTDEAAGTAGMTLVEQAEPNAAENDVVLLQLAPPSSRMASENGSGASWETCSRC